MQEQKEYISKVELSVRRKEIKGLPGDDASLHNLKIGSSLKGKGPLRGLEFDEEKKYLPEIINISPQDNEWRSATRDYWNNISVPVPADGLTTAKLQGLLLTFILSFKSSTAKDAFDRAISFEEKARIAQKSAEVVDGVEDYVLWRYCLVYGKVANRFQDIGKSPKILFYLYSKETETLAAHNVFQTKRKAQDVFAKILSPEKESVVDAVLLMFGQDLSTFENIQDKHLALDTLIGQRPKEFLKYMEDGNLNVKAFINKAVDARILHRPANTDSYYYGDNNEVCLGKTLDDAVLYVKSDEQKNKDIVDVIKAKLKNL